LGQQRKAVARQEQPRVLTVARVQQTLAVAVAVEALALALGILEEMAVLAWLLLPTQIHLTTFKQFLV
jgi:hypothetical protein